MKNARNAALWFASILIALGRCLGGTVEGEAVNGTLNIGFLLDWTLGWAVGGKMAGALVVGLEEVQARNILPGYNIEWIFEDSGCREQMGFRAAVQLWSESNDLDALIGDGCSVVCQPVSLLTAAWNLPTISYGCASDLLSDKEVYPTFTRTVGTWPGLAPEFVALVQAFGWTRVAVVTTLSDLNRRTAENTKFQLGRAGVKVFYHAMETTVDGDQINPGLLASQQEVVRAVKAEARIILLFMYGLDIRNFLISCYDEGMLNGGYVFTALDSLYLLSSSFTYRPELGPELFVGVIDTELRVTEGPVWDAFAQEVLDAFDDPHFEGWDHLNSNDSVSEVDVYAGFLHDAVLMWAYGVNRTIERGGPVDDGTIITQNLLNFTFEGITGTLAIDENGDRKADQTVSIIQPGGQVVTIFTWEAAYDTLVPVYSNDTPSEWTGLVWSGNQLTVPSDMPPCGWDDDLCIVEPQIASDQITIGIVVAVTVLLLLIGTVFFHLNYKRKMNEQQALAFVIHPSTLLRKRGSIAKTETGEDMSIRTLSTNRLELQTPTPSMHSAVSGDSTNMHLEQVPFNNVIGFYNAMRVSIRKYGYRRRWIMDDGVLTDLKQVLQGNHENVNRIIGICPLISGVIVVSEYATRGSILDLIANAEIKLTREIKLSLTTDIIRGMMFLHDTDIGSHGHLKSTNCVVDNRLTCKITDYGLRHIRRGTEADSWREKLWTAPEVLRDHSEKDPKKADVYSFGVIVYELITEMAIWDGPKTPQEMVQRVVQLETPPFRPNIDPQNWDPDWAKMVRDCWEEDWRERIAFRSALQQVREINGGRLPCLVDSMISRLERHATDLEGMVDERTLEVAYEKQRVEDLLSELLPHSVAVSLVKGGKMEPEMFNAVSVFFSDIVGFTRLSAASTPMQTIDFLNQLYTMFDRTLALFDVYKVATIGDAYLVASGLPVPNGDRHAVEIASMSFRIIANIREFTIRHLPREKLRVRIGVHSGSCVGAITGIKMPRYLLFGETIELVQKIESGGAPMKVHASEAFVLVLDRSASFDVEFRGVMPVKGRQSLNTYWVDE